MIEADEMEAQVHRGGLAGGGEHAAVFDVEDVGVHRHQGVAPGQLSGVHPVRGGASAVQQTGGSQHEGSRRSEATRAPASWAARTASTSSPGGSWSTSAQPGTITVVARDLAAPDTPAPDPVDEHGRSDQTFLVDVDVRAGGDQRRAVARGLDIYAVTAPLVVEAVERVLTGRTRTVGVASAGAVFDSVDFLHAPAQHVDVELQP